MAKKNNPVIKDLEGATIVATPTPKAVATPTVKKSSVYSKAWETNYSKQQALPTPVIFELISSKKDAKGKRTYPVSAFFEAREIIYDPTTNKRREIRYCKNEPSIYVEEQNKLSRPETLKFSQGIIVVMPDNPALLEYLRASNLNKSNKNRLSDLNPEFFEVSKKKEATVSIEDEITSLEAIQLALTAPLEKIIPIAKYLGVNTNRSISEIRYDLKSMATKNVKGFTELFDNKEAFLTGSVKMSQEYGIIKIENSKISWDNGTLITAIPMGKDAYVALIDHLKEEKIFEKFQTSLESKLEAIMNS
jgi:aspartate carbamoyltransferase regulatory subunit